VIARIGLLLAVGGLVACTQTPLSSGGPSAGSSASAAPSIGASIAPSQGEGYAQIRLNISGGPWDGNWAGQIVTGGCSRNLIASENPIVPVFVDNTFSAGAAEVSGIPDLLTFLFEIYDAADAVNGTDQFHFGALATDLTTGLLIDPTTGEGQGTATLADAGATATLHGEGTFADGSTGTVDIDCYEVEDGTG
jgi:hypothetical protein